MQPLFLHPRDLDLDALHLFWAAPPDAVLTASLATLGQTTPALAFAAEGRPILAAGARRALALRERRGRTLAAVVLEERDMEPDLAALPQALRLGAVYLASNLGRTVTDAMAVAAGRYFVAAGGPEAFEALAAPRLFPEGDRRRALVGQWLALPPSLDALLASGNLPLGAAGRLAALDDASRQALAPLFHAVRWSRANLDNALTWLVEAARLAGEPPAAILGRCGALDLPGRGLSPNDLAAGVLAALRRARYPATTTLEARFASLSRAVTPKGSKARLSPSQGFEADAVTVTATARSPQELAKIAADIAAMAAASELPRLLRVAHEDDPA
ncbi:chromosome partitioning protein ParB [Solidesulfovibrio sp.]|uniref:chromosome partitioning protein ParB n=1 Tax=Solidesulfovibrio sp. TaxID=2910990 RepID=UPI002633EA9B|nr:chromosome partitioning protein ParB [Solidesulfovibrio sp.]